MSLTFPARFMLAAAMNPCPCGFHNDRTRDCQCTTPMIQRYVSKISGPLMDRIDIHIDVPAVNYKEMRSHPRAGKLGHDSRTRHPRPPEATGTLRHFPRKTLLQCADALPPHPHLLRTLRRLRAPARTRHDPARPERPRPRPHPESSPHRRRPGRLPRTSSPNTSPKPSNTAASTARTGRKRSK